MKRNLRARRVLQVLSRTLTAGAFSCVAWNVTAVPAQAVDSALLVGVDQYPNARNMNLDGCRNDVILMREVLQGLGFKVTALTSTQTTRHNILQTLETMRTQMQPGDRFVFHFSGQSSLKDNRTILWPRDIEKLGDKNGLPVGELHRRIASIPARSRTIFLDCDFGARGSAAPAATTLSAPGSNKICYFAAAREKDAAGEMRFDGVSHGVFTYYLAQHLRQTADQLSAVSWAELEQQVAKDVNEKRQGRQRPRVSDAYRNTAVFEALGTAPRVVQVPAPVPPAPAPPISLSPLADDDADKTDGDAGGAKEKKSRKLMSPLTTLWGAYSATKSDEQQLKLRMTPDKIKVNVGELCTYQIEVGNPGYLVVLERGTSGKINLLFPADRNAETALVEGTKVIPGEGFAFAPEAPGMEQIRALLFADRDAATALLERFAPDNSLESALDLAGSPIEAPFHSADWLFEVAP